MSKKTKASSAPSQTIDPHTWARAYLNKCAGGAGKPSTLHYYQGQFHRWDGSHYHVVSNNQFRAEVTQAMHEYSAEQAAGIGGVPVKITKSFVSNIIQALAGLTLVDEQIDLPVWLEPKGNRNASFLSMENGLVDFDGLLNGLPITVKKPSPYWFSPVSLPYAFDPDAKCPQWRDFLNEVLERDEERVHLLQEWFGYCLTRNTGEQKFIFMEGEGRNGKGVVCQILTDVLGEENVSNVPLEAFGDKFQLATTIGKLLNISTEAVDLPRSAETTLKALTGGDRMYFDLKNLTGVNVHPSARFLFTGNNRPKFQDRTDGVWRRLILMPFRINITEEKMDKQLVEKLRTELPGILNWAVEGERRRRKQGGFTKSKVGLDALMDYQHEMNPARVFLTDHVEADPTGEVLCLDIYKTYKGWCEEAGKKPLDDTAFGKEITRKFGKTVTRKRKSSGKPRPYYYEGIRLLGSDSQSEDQARMELLGFPWNPATEGGPTDLPVSVS